MQLEAEKKEIDSETHLKIMAEKETVSAACTPPCMACLSTAGRPLRQAASPLCASEHHLSICASTGTRPEGPGETHERTARLGGQSGQSAGRHHEVSGGARSWGGRTCHSSSACSRSCCRRRHGPHLAHASGAQGQRAAGQLQVPDELEPGGAGAVGVCAEAKGADDPCFRVVDLGVRNDSVLAQALCAGRVTRDGRKAALSARPACVTIAGGGQCCAGAVSEGRFCKAEGAGSRRREAHPGGVMQLLRCGAGGKGGLPVKACLLKDCPRMVWGRRSSAARQTWMARSRLPRGRKSRWREPPQTSGVEEKAAHRRTVQHSCVPAVAMRISCLHTGAGTALVALGARDRS